MLSDTERSWESIGQTRVLIGLAFSSVLPIALSLPLFWLVMLEGSPVSFKSIASFALYGAAVEVWAIAVGLVGVFGVLRRRGRVSRRGLLLMTGLGAFFVPTAGLIAGSTFRGPPDIDVLSMAAFFGILGIAGIPFGLIGGWIFWRFSVRPAPISTATEARAFD